LEANPAHIAMNPEIESSIESLVGDLPDAERSEARTILRACNFQDASDPIFGLLRYQQLREASAGEAEKALAKREAKLAEEMDNRLWEAARIKLSFVFILLVITFLFGFLLAGILFVHAARANPRDVSNYLGLTDSRLTQIENAGVRLRVQDKPDEFLIGLKGNFVNLVTGAENEQILLFHK